jgi:hypothetical protein
MTEKDDDKPVISLAAKREATERDFAQRGVFGWDEMAPRS